MATGSSHDIKKPPPQRLLSLRGERDLTLGGLTLNNKKKNFCPVLPSQAKPKVKQEIVSEFAPPPEVKLKAGVLQRNDRTKHNGKDAGRGRGRHGCAEPNIDESQFVQMKSVFSEGPMMAQAHVNSRLHSGGGSRSGEKTAKVERKASVGFVKSRDKREEAMDWEADTKDVLEQLLRDDFINDHSFSASSEQEMAPVSLPQSLSHRLEVKTKPKVKCKALRPMRRIKDDDEDEINVKQASCRANLSTSRSSASLQPAEIFAADSALQNELLLFQLPDVLPGVPFSKDSGQKTTNPGTHDALKCSLSDFEENAVGRLVVRRSGRTQLVLGNVAFDVSAGSTSSCLQDLASLRVDEGAVGSLTVLGHVHHKLLCIPDLTSLLSSGHSGS